ncbi:MAG: hypothetical protein D3924_06250 [Candidatus Electrothrix sp. AR4]|nr:hypothetical protein [Candidatus Electrothrix sp. AR4]
MRIRKKEIVFLVTLSLAFCLSACQESSTEKLSTPEKKSVEVTKPPEPEEVQKEVVVEVIEESAAEKKEVVVTEKDFGCIRDMKKVDEKFGGMYVSNILGDAEATLAVASSETGGVYPPGSIVQLLPGEAMVKREKGASPATNDWEFFVLDVSEQGSKIKQRGFDKVGNMFGSCLSCHQQAAAQDMICGGGEACAPINFPGIDDTKVLISALQKTDKRCSPDPDAQPTPEEIEVLKKLQALMQAAAEKKAAEAVEATAAESETEE